MDFTLSDEQRTLLEAVRAFVDERVDPRMEEIEASNSIPQEIFDEASSLGLFGISIPEEYGGSGLSRLSRALVHQMLGRERLLLCGRDGIPIPASGRTACRTRHRGAKEAPSPNGDG
jgi:acyl-CoA dehydrogenase